MKKRMFGVEKKILCVAFRVDKDASPTASSTLTCAVDPILQASPKLISLHYESELSFSLPKTVNCIMLVALLKPVRNQYSDDRCQLCSLGLHAFVEKGIERLVVEDPEKRKRLVSSVHDSSHFGVNRTLDMICSKYYWPGLTSDVKCYVSGVQLYIV